MADDTIKYVRLATRLQSRSQVDINSGWSISGLDVKEVPDKQKYPNAARFVRQKLNQGVLEPASQAEYEEVQEAHEESRERLQERMEDLAAMGISPTNFGFAVHQEGAIQNAARARREKLQREDEGPTEYEQDRARRKQVAGNEDEQSDDYNDWNVDDLRDELKARELQVSGNKADLVERLEQNDAETEDENDGSDEG